MKILVTGATGTCGGAVVGDLLTRGASVRALARKKPETGKLPQGLEMAVGDLTDPPSILKALDGIDKMFLLIGNVADEFTPGVTAYGLARRAGLNHITYLSVLQADRFLDVPHFAGKAAIECIPLDLFPNFAIDAQEALWRAAGEERGATRFDLWKVIGILERSN